MLHLPLPSNLSLTETSSVGVFFPECDSDQCLLPHRCAHRASHEDALYEACTRLFHRSCHWHAVLHCHPAAPARGLPSIRSPLYLRNTLTAHKHSFAMLGKLSGTFGQNPLVLCLLLPVFASLRGFSRAVIRAVEGFGVCSHCITDHLGGLYLCALHVSLSVLHWHLCQQGFSQRSRVYYFSLLPPQPVQWWDTSVLSVSVRHLENWSAGPFKRPVGWKQCSFTAVGLFKGHLPAFVSLVMAGV